MAIYTKNGLKLRFDERALNSVIGPLKASGVYEDILMDLEIWMNMPNAISNVAAILSIIFIGSWVSMLFMGIIGFFIGAIISYSFYSDSLKKIFPLFLGTWIIVGLFALLLGYGLIIHGRILAAVVLLAIIVGNQAHVFDFLLLFLTPYRIFLLKKYGIGFTERIFMLMCDRRAKKLNMKLDWNLYGKTMKELKNALKKEGKSAILKPEAQKEPKMSKKQTTYEEDYNELLNDLAEARNAANRLRSVIFKDDSSPFNPKLTEDEAYWIIKRAVKANEEERLKEDN